jgi:hypothetical protein
MDEQRQYPDITDILTQKARGRRERALLSFGEKLEILDRLRENVAPIVEARLIRTHHGDQAKSSGMN